MATDVQATSQTSSMLSHFRRQFVTMNMIFAGVVMLVVFIVVSSIMLSQHQKDVYDALAHRIDMARSRNNVVPGFSGLSLNNMQGHAFDNRTPFESNDGMDVPRESQGDQFVATSLFVLDEDDTLIASYDEAFPIDTTVLNRALDSALAKMDDAGERGQHMMRGTVGSQNLYYQIEPYQHGYLVAFASGNYVDRNMHGLIVPLLASEFAALLAFLVVSILLARWVVRPVEEAWDKQQQFIADASHELKTPLTVIRANNSLLLSQPEATVESQSQWIESTETEAQLMQDLVNDMLYLAKADNDQIPLELNTVNVTDIVNMQLLQFESVAFEKNIDIQSNIDKDVEILGDGPRLQRLVGTLLDNACKYTDEGGVVRVSLTHLVSTCRFEVQNSGAPIDAEELPHLFDRFYRGDKARTRTQGGYGLGLAIAKTIVEEHKGIITVKSSQDAGTTFTVTLPIE